MCLKMCRQQWCWTGFWSNHSWMCLKDKLLILQFQLHHTFKDLDKFCWELFRYLSGTPMAKIKTLQCCGWSVSAYRIKTLLRIYAQPLWVYFYSCHQDQPCRAGCEHEKTAGGRLKDEAEVPAGDGEKLSRAGGRAGEKGEHSVTGVE